MDGDAVKLSWAGQNFELLSARAMHWPSEATLILSDVHLGKAHDFQTLGVPIPSAIHIEDLRRLDRLLAEFKPGRVLVLGDFVHSHRSELDDLAREFRALKAGHAAKWVLTVGNHDRQAQSRLTAWRFDEIKNEIFERGIRFSHGHSQAQGPSVSGHMHPVFKWGEGRDRLRLPCFWVRETEVVIPSFGEFTGGYEIRPTSGDRVFVVAEGHVAEVGTRIAHKP